MSYLNIGRTEDALTPFMIVGMPGSLDQEKEKEWDGMDLFPRFKLGFHALFIQSSQLRAGLAFWPPNHGLIMHGATRRFLSGNLTVILPRTSS